MQGRPSRTATSAERPIGLGVCDRSTGRLQLFPNRQPVASYITRFLATRGGIKTRCRATTRSGGLAEADMASLARPKLS
jgi:hypothetical protein